MTNAQIMETIGARDLLVPELVNDALAANDRIKYFLTLLQTAKAHAEQPLTPVVDLRATRQSSGVTDAELDSVAAGSRLAGDGMLLIPSAERIRQALFDDVKKMIEPLRIAAKQDRDQREQPDAYYGRLNAQADAAGSWVGQQVSTRTIDALTAAGDENRDTLHRLVMDLHRELNRLLAEAAVESIDGARASGLTAADRAHVMAFMEGLNATAPLKFDHPGLATTAARYRDGLSIQNDLGTTEGHIVVVRVEGSSVTIVYSDVHQKRIRFLRTLLDRFPVVWQDIPAGTGDTLKMIVGTFPVPDEAALRQFLSFVGSRLVFLIDWNRARKQLRQFVGKSDAADILSWAAANNVGHRGFLQSGGAQLIATAFERVAPSRIRFGTRLDDVIGREAAGAFLKAVFRIATVGLTGGHSQRLIQDEVEAELLTHVRTTDGTILDTASEHAMFISALAERMRRVVTLMSDSHPADDFARSALLASQWERQADEIVRQSSRALDHSGGHQTLGELLRQADDVADALEEAAFLLTLLPDGTPRERVSALRGLADLVADGTKEYVRCLEHAKDIASAQTRADIEDVLVSVDRIGIVEHNCDAAERAAQAMLVRLCIDFRELGILFDVARTFEEAADALSRCALTLRDYALAPLTGRI